MNFRGLWDRIVGSTSFGEAAPMRPLDQHIEQQPRYDLLDDAAHQHFHLFDWETLADHAVDPDRFPKVVDQHLCRAHLLAQERLTGAYQIARCGDLAYVVQVADDCDHGCDACRSEREQAANLIRRQDAFWRSDEGKRFIAQAMDEHPYRG